MTKGDIAILRMGKLNFNIWDYTGEEQFSFLWEEFVKGSDVILLVTDSSMENVEKSKFFLDIIKHEYSHAVAAVISNKQDLENALEPEKIENILGLKIYRMVAIDQRNQTKMVQIITDLLNVSDEASHQLNLLIERKTLRSDLDQVLANKDHKKAAIIIKKITDICLELGDEALREEFYEMGQNIMKTIQQEIEYLEASTPKAITEPPKFQKKLSKEELLKSLIKNYMEDIESITSVIVTDREGAIIFSESKKGTGSESTIGLPEIVGKSDQIEKSAIRVICPICKTNKKISIPKHVIDEAKNVVTFSIPKRLVCDHHFQVFVDKNIIVRGYQMVDYEFDGYLGKIINDITSEDHYCNVITTEQKKLAYCSRGPNSLLTTITLPSTSDVKLRVYSEHIAGKVELILEGHDNVDVDIPQVIKTIAKTKGGELPKGKFYLKTILVGDFKVGKTSLINRFVRNTFKADYQSTIGVDLSEKLVTLNEDTDIQFIIWDIAGQKKSIAPYRKKFYKGANFALIVLERTRPNNIESIRNLYNDIKDHATSEIIFVLIGNKSDLADEIITSEEDIKKIADHYGFHSYILTSAKTGENVNDAFLNIAYTFLESV